MFIKTRVDAKRALLLVGLAVSFAFFLATNAWAERYFGQVVDEETGKPLEGVGITVVWFRVPYVYMDRTYTFHSAQETLTDKEGKFSLEVAPGIDWSPFTHVLKEPEVVVFKPEYKPLLNLTPFRMTGSVLRLEKLKTREEQLKYVSLSGFSFGATFPPSALPTLTRLINIQSKMLGLQPIW
jgi:hypothetical protein